MQHHNVNNKVRPPYCYSYLIIAGTWDNVGNKSFVEEHYILLDVIPAYNYNAVKME